MPDAAPRQLILTLFGLYAREENNWLSVSSVVRLMGDIGVDSVSARSSISRLKRRGVLTALKVEQMAGYALSENALELLRDGDVRIFDHHRASLNDGLVLVVFSIPESERQKRHVLRTALTRMGFGTASAGVWVAPWHLHDHVRRSLERLELLQYVEVFQSRPTDPDRLADRLGEWWDLESIDAEYSAFISRYQTSATRWRDEASSVAAAFEIYVPMLTEWRRLPYRDPGLPLDLLPVDWSGGRAEKLFAGLDELLREPAHQHALEVLHP